MPYCDYIFGNETEAATYAEHHGLSADTPIEEIAKHISKLDKINKSRPRTVVFTQVSKLLRNYYVIIILFLGC